MRIAAHRIASVVGFNDPAAKGAIVRGIRPAEIRRSKVQWYEPCDGLGGGTGAASFATKSLAKLWSPMPESNTSSVNHLCIRCQLSGTFVRIEAPAYEEEEAGLLVSRLRGRQQLGLHLAEHP